MFLARIIVLGLAVAIAVAHAQGFSDLTTPLPLPPGGTLVIGFLGGWDHWNDPNRGVRKLALKLRDDERDVFAEALSNHRQSLALQLIHAALDTNRDGHLDAIERAQARIILYGQSLGGGAVVRMARKLAALNIPVMLTVQVDSVSLHDGVIPANVAAAVNLFQRDGPPIMGRPRIRAADPAHTRIEGNFQYHYRSKEIDLSSASWKRKAFGGAHTKMELDPEVWARVEGYILNAIRSDQIPSLKSAIASQLPGKSTP